MRLNNVLWLFVTIHCFPSYLLQSYDKLALIRSRRVFIRREISYYVWEEQVGLIFLPMLQLEQRILTLTMGKFKMPINLKGLMVRLFPYLCIERIQMHRV